MLMIRRLLIFCGIVYLAEGTRMCPNSTKAHLTRCDMYYRCTVLPSDNIVWMAKTCPNGLVYDKNYGNCVLPGDDWECQLDSESRSASDKDDDNVYGVNNLSYLRKQIKAYDIDEDDDSRENTDNDEELIDDDDQNVLITMSNNGTMIFESRPNATSNASAGDFESSGDGELDDESLENKSGYVQIPNNSDVLVSSQLQRLSQLMRKVNKNQNGALTPDDLNQYLTLHKLIHQRFPSSTQAESLPHDKLIDDHHLKQILDLQKRLNNFANTRDTYSTPPTPTKFIAFAGDGIYPSDATTVHIKATNGVKPTFPGAGYTSSQIVVNRPGGSVVFRLPNSDYPQKNTKKKQENQISEETLKTLLELSKHMSNYAPNTPNFVHSLPPNSYVQSNAPNSYAQPMIQPIQPYNFPWDQLGLSSLLATLGAKKSDVFQSDETSSMEKIASMSASVPTTANAVSDPDDTGTTTIVHNNIPITISHPTPTNSIVNRIQSVSTTMRPFEDRYDSYGIKQSEHTDLNDYYPYPPYSENFKKNSGQSLPSAAGTPIAFASPFSTQPTRYDQNIEQPQYIQIAQSRPDHYVPIYPTNTIPTNTIMSDTMRPIPTFASVDGGYTQKFYTTYTPQPHQGNGDVNVNELVHIHRKPYPASKPVNYVQIASSLTPSYADPPKHFTAVRKHQHITDKVDHFIDSNEPNENGHSNEQYETNDDDDDTTNVEQNNNENVMDLLANYNSQIKPDSPEPINNPVQKRPAIAFKATANPSNHKQFVNLNGNFMSLETYQQSIEPYLQKNPDLDAHIEVLTCATGVRQANSTDCTRYFVCNEKTGKILSYSCPPYTAFNADTKICNAETYSRCVSGVTNNKMHPQTQLSIMEANRIKAEAVKAQQLAHLIRLETDKILHQAHQVRHKQQMMGGGKATAQTLTQPSQPVAPNQTYRKPQTNQTPITRNKQKVKNAKRPAKKPRGKRKVPCKKEGKLVDNLSQLHYFLCYKDQTQTMRARRLQCPAKLLFCPSSLVCTATDRCMNKFNRL